MEENPRLTSTRVVLKLETAKLTELLIPGFNINKSCIEMKQLQLHPYQLLRLTSTRVVLKFYD